MYYVGSRGSNKHPKPGDYMSYRGNENIIVLDHSPQIKALMTMIRSKDTRRNDFIFYADRLTRILVERGLELLPVKEKKVTTPLDQTYNGLEFEGKICAVPIIRAGESMEKAVREVCKKIRIGKILIQRDEEDASPILFYSKLPNDISKRYILLLDPMLATGGSVCAAIKILKDKGVLESKMIFINLLSSEEGLKKVHGEYPEIKIVTGEVDPELNDKAFICPGLGDFGDRYFGT